MSQGPVDPNTHTETPLSAGVPVYAPTGAEDDDLGIDDDVPADSSDASDDDSEA